MKKYLFLLLTFSMIIPMACQKEQIQEEPTVIVVYIPGSTGLPNPWADGDIEEMFNKQRIIDFFKDKGIKIIEVKLSTEIPGPRPMGPGSTYIYCRIFERDVTAILEYGFRL